jgi:hypothetical protein
MSRRTLRIASGVAVLLITFVYAHIVHHVFFVAHRQELSPGLWIAGLIITCGLGILSFIGAYLLLTGGAPQNPN